MSDETSPGRKYWELALQLGEIEAQMRSLEADAARDQSPDKEPFDIAALAAVYPFRLAPARLSAAAIEALRTKYYLDFSGTTLQAYADELTYHDMHESN
jgi:hypothetical protein